MIVNLWWAHWCFHWEICTKKSLSYWNWYIVATNSGINFLSLCILLLPWILMSTRFISTYTLCGYWCPLGLFIALNAMCFIYLKICYKCWKSFNLPASLKKFPLKWHVLYVMIQLNFTLLSLVVYCHLFSKLF